jgi:hypothetical protein
VVTYIGRVLVDVCMSHCSGVKKVILYGYNNNNNNNNNKQKRKRRN